MVYPGLKTVAIFLSNSNLETFDVATWTRVSVNLPSIIEKEFRTGRDAFLDFVDNPYVYYTSGAVIYSLKHLKENRIFFEGRITADLELNLQLMMHGNVAFIDEQIYIIRRHGNNASTSVTDLHELEYSYLDLLRVIYNKAKITWPDEQALDEWYNKTILRHLEKSIYLVRLQNNYKLSMQFHRILYKKYRREYLNLIKKHPKYILKIILNR